MEEIIMYFRNGIHYSCEKEDYTFMILERVPNNFLVLF